MNPAHLYGRKIAIRIGGLEISADDKSGLHVEFECEKRHDGKPNTATVKVINLSPSHRGELAKVAASAKSKNVLVEILAGYNMPARIFRGDLRSVLHERDEADWHTMIEAGDGEFTIKNAKISRSFAPGISVEVVLTAIVEAMGLGNGNTKSPTVKQYTKLLQAKGCFVGGTVLSGKAVNELRRITRSMGIEFSIQDGTLQLLGDGKALEGTAVLLNSNTGLVGIPKPYQKNGKSYVELECLLVADLFPGRKIRVESELITGFFVCQMIRFRGSNFGDDFGAEIDAVQL